ncbi:hypothetical protein [Microcoleus phage My-WqHQDG]|nr:hypothetical protein [Microcoleus phage My-WqHQDG]
MNTLDKTRLKGYITIIAGVLGLGSTTLSSLWFTFLFLKAPEYLQWSTIATITSPIGNALLSILLPVSWVYGAVLLTLVLLVVITGVLLLVLGVINDSKGE